MQIKLVDRRTLKPAKFNPSGRTEEARLKYLRHSIEQHGFLSAFPIIITDDGTVADGHRRLAVAEMLGIDKVPVLVANNLSAAEYWSLNAIGQSPTATEVLEAYTRGMDALPDKHRGNIELMQAVLGGKAKLRAMFSKGKFTPAVYTLAKRAANYCGRGDDAGFLSQIATWIIERKMQRALTVALGNGIDVDVLAAAVVEDRPLTLVIEFR